MTAKSEQQTRYYKVSHLYQNVLYFLNFKYLNNRYLWHEHFLVSSSPSIKLLGVNFSIKLRCGILHGVSKSFGVLETHRTVLQNDVLKRQYIIGFAAEFRGVKLWMKVATAMFVWVSGTYPYTCSRSNTMYGLQQRMNTETSKDQRKKFVLDPRMLLASASYHLPVRNFFKLYF